MSFSTLTESSHGHESSQSLLTSITSDEIHSLDYFNTTSDEDHDIDNSRCFVPPSLEDSSDLFEPLYSGSTISFCGAVCSIMQFCMTYKLSYTAIGELLKLLQLLCPMPNKLPPSVFLLKKFFNCFKMSYDYSNLCSNCSVNKEDCQCDHPVYKSHLIHVPLQKPLFAVLSSKYKYKDKLEIWVGIMAA